MVTALAGVQQIVATIRAEMAGRVQPGMRQPKPAARTADQDATAQSRMGRLIGERVRALDPDDPRRARKALRIFLESVLLGELGEELINDQAFYQLVDQVQETM